MLVLTRKIGEEVIIGGSISVKITEIWGDKVRISVTAPPDTLVLRKEVMERNREFSELEPVVPTR